MRERVCVCSPPTHLLLFGGHNQIQEDIDAPTLDNLLLHLLTSDREVQQQRSSPEEKLWVVGFAEEGDSLKGA